MKPTTNLYATTESVDMTTLSETATMKPTTDLMNHAIIGSKKYLL
jgi:hypothetical protein